MAFAPASTDLALLRGEFRNVEFDNQYEFGAAAAGEFLPFADYQTKVFVGAGIGGDQGFRWAKVLKTVAYVVVDEDADGKPVVEKWAIKNHREYAR